MPVAGYKQTYVHKSMWMLNQRTKSDGLRHELRFFGVAKIALGLLHKVKVGIFQCPVPPIVDESRANCHLRQEAELLPVLPTIHSKYVSVRLG